MFTKRPASPRPAVARTHSASRSLILTNMAPQNARVSASCTTTIPPPMPARYCHHRTAASHRLGPFPRRYGGSLGRVYGQIDVLISVSLVHGERGDVIHVPEERWHRATSRPGSGKSIRLSMISRSKGRPGPFLPGRCQIQRELIEMKRAVPFYFGAALFLIIPPKIDLESSACRRGS